MKYTILYLLVFSLFLNSCSNKYFNLDNDIDNKVPAWFIDFKDEDEKKYLRNSYFHISRYAVIFRKI